MKIEKINKLVDRKFSKSDFYVKTDEPLMYYIDDGRDINNGYFSVMYDLEYDDYSKTTNFDIPHFLVICGRSGSIIYHELINSYNDAKLCFCDYMEGILKNY